MQTAMMIMFFQFSHAFILFSTLTVYLHSIIVECNEISSFEVRHKFYILYRSHQSHITFNVLYNSVSAIVFPELKVPYSNSVLLCLLSEVRGGRW